MMSCRNSPNFQAMAGIWRDDVDGDAFVVKGA